MTIQNFLLDRRRLDVFDRDSETGLGRVAVAKVLDAVETSGHICLVVVVRKFVDDAPHCLLVDTRVLELEALGQRRVEEDSTSGRGAVGLATGLFTNDVIWVAVLDQRMQLDVASFVRTLDLLEVAEHATFARTTIDFFSQVIGTNDHVLCRGDERTTIGRRKDVVRRKHEHAGLGLRFC